MTLTDAKDSVSSVSVVGHEIIAGSIDGKVRTYDIRMGQIFVDVIGCTYILLQDMLSFKAYANDNRLRNIPHTHNPSRLPPNLNPRFHPPPLRPPKRKTPAILPLSTIQKH